MAIPLPQPRRPEWSPQQDAALHKVDRWLARGGDQQLFRIFGYA